MPTQHRPSPDDRVFASRIERARAQLDRLGCDALCVSVGADLPYLIGYEAMPLERLTMLVVDRSGHPTLVIPELEVARVEQRPEVFEVVGWGETEDPITLVSKRLGNAGKIAMGDTTWARFVVDLVNHRPSVELMRSAPVMSPLRSVKDAAEIDALRTAAEAADRVIAQIQAGDVALVGRTEAEVSADVSARLIAEGHDVVNFAIVAAGPNAASPHHHAGSTVISERDCVLFDIGGTLAGYCSDITRCVSIGEPSSEMADLYSVLHEAQRAAVGIAGSGADVTCQDVDREARRIIAEAGYGQYFIHRTGHGIGMEEHEDPYIVEGNDAPLVAGNAFSVEPGIYVPGRHGARLEDIVVAGDRGPDQLNQADHSLVIVGG
ncbi:MAG: Xaa-Pro peptidase family protein [Acidimicrobiales bacterium]